LIYYKKIFMFIVYYMIIDANLLHEIKIHITDLGMFIFTCLPPSFT